MRIPEAASVDASESAPQTASKIVTPDPGRADPSALIGSVLVDEIAIFQPAGAIARAHAAAIWQWLSRDVDPDLPARLQVAARAAGPAKGNAICADIVRYLGEALADAAAGEEPARRIRVQIGDKDAFDRLGHIMRAFESRPMLVGAETFGEALNGLKDAGAVAAALKSLSARTEAYPFLMYAATTRVSDPYRLVTAIVMAAGGSTAGVVRKSGLAPVMEALLAHAQNFLGPICVDGPFADMDRTCRAIAGFHALIRAVSIVTETDGRGRWAQLSARLVTRVSDHLGPRLHRIEADLRHALDPSRNGDAVSDSIALFDALNGIYLLDTVRNARDVLGVHSTMETVWAGTGEVLEILIDRNLAALRRNPGDEAAMRRLDAAVAMARIRFSPGYADVIMRAVLSVTGHPQKPDSSLYARAS